MVQVRMKCFLITLSRMEAIAMQELSSVDQRHLESQTEGEPSNENDKLTPEQPGWSRRKRRQKGRACAKQQTNLKKRAQNRPSVWTRMTSVLKVMWKFCTTTYDIASDFLQGKQALFDFSKIIHLIIKMENTCFHYYCSTF